MNEKLELSRRADRIRSEQNREKSSREKRGGSEWSKKIIEARSEKSGTER